MSKYANGKIYKVFNSKNKIIYIGSTIRLISDRMSDHRVHARNGLETPFAKAMRGVGIEFFDIELIRNYPCESRKELLDEENREIKKYPRSAIYNDSIDGKMSEDARRKYKETVATKTPKTEEEKKIIGEKMSKAITKRGCLFLIGNSYYIFGWYENRIRKQISFSKYKYGTLEKALATAIEFQNKIFPLAKNDEKENNDDKEEKNPYHNSKIYKVINDVTDKIYIGSTTSSLPTKLTRHRGTAKRSKSKFYTAMKNIGFDKFKIELIRDVNKVQLKNILLIFIYVISN